MTINTDLLKRISDEFAVTSSEEPTIDLVKSILDTNNIDYDQDLHGNILVGNTNNPLYGFASHLDEIGIIVKNIRSDGLIKFDTVGYIHPVTLLNSQIVLNTGTSEVYGHVYSGRMFAGGLSNHELMHDELVLDIGVSTREEVLEQGIELGTLGTYKKVFSETTDSVFATGLDNSIGIYLMLELLLNEPDLKNCVYLFHRGEECGSYGAKTFSNSVTPKYMFVLDCFPAVIEATHNSDIYPNVLEGPALVYVANDYIIDGKVKSFLENVAANCNVNIQKCFMAAKGSSEVPHFQSHGTLGANICVPVRGFHSQNYTVFKSDIEQTYTLLKNIKQNFTEVVTVEANQNKKSMEEGAK